MPTAKKIRPTRDEVLAVVAGNGNRTRTTLNEIGFAILSDRQPNLRLTGLAAETAEHISMSVIQSHLKDLCSLGDIVQTTTVRRNRRVTAWESIESVRIRERSNAAVEKTVRRNALRHRGEVWAAAELRRMHPEEFENLVRTFINNPAEQEYRT